MLDIQSRFRYSYCLSPYVVQVSQGIVLYPPDSGRSQPNWEPDRGSAGVSQLNVPCGGNRTIRANRSYSIAKRFNEPLRRRSHIANRLPFLVRDGRTVSICPFWLIFPDLSFFRLFLFLCLVIGEPLPTMRRGKVFQIKIRRPQNVFCWAGRRPHENI